MEASNILQCLLGLQCKDFVMIAADQVNITSIIIIKHDEDKLHVISDKLVLAAIGDPADAVQLVQYVTKNLQLYRIKNGYDLSPAAVAHFTRKSLSDGLRAGNQLMVNMLLCGYSEIEGSHLYSLDFLGSCVKVPFATQGGALLSVGIMDKHYRDTLTEAEAYELIKMCVQEVHTRLVLNLPSFQVKVISKDGIKSLPVITPPIYASS